MKQLKVQDKQIRWIALLLETVEATLEGIKRLSLIRLRAVNHSRLE